MASSARGAFGRVSWHRGNIAPGSETVTPIFGVNDNGDIDYRAVAAAAARLWRDFDSYSSQLAAHRAQAAFWQGRMASCRWWHSVARMLDRAMLAGYSLRTPPERPSPPDRRDVAANR
jgi:hypothetical protein